MSMLYSISQKEKCLWGVSRFGIYSFNLLTIGHSGLHMHVYVVSCCIKDWKYYKIYTSKTALMNILTDNTTEYNSVLTH